MTTGKKSAAKREAVALALASGRTARARASACGVAERTIAYWLTEPGFLARVEELRSALLERTMARLIRGTTKAQARLCKLVGSKDDKLALRAAVAVLEQATRLRETVTLDARIRALEQAEAARKAKGTKP
jgi:hypothetical protein